MRFMRYPALMGVLALLAGCAQGISVFDDACKASPSSVLANVDWDTARKINLRIRQDTFTPTYLGLIQGAPYRLMIENADDDSHVFRAAEFFRSVAVADVRVISGPGAGVKTPYSCSGAIAIAPGGITEARFVSVRDGVYEFDNNSVLLSFALTGSAGGFIIIERRRQIPESPVKHLKFLERKPLVTSPVSAPSGSLFDDDTAPEQPIDAKPTVPVEEMPVEELPVDEILPKDQPKAMLDADQQPAAPVIDDTQLNKAPAADLFSD